MEKNQNKIFNIPNALTFLRILLIIPFSLSVMKENYINAGIILVLSGITDLLDGLFARKLKIVTEFGKVLDPIADKLTLIAVMICTANKFKEIFPFMMLLLGKEFSMLLAGAFLLGRKKFTFAAQWYGKVSTAFFYFSLIIIIGLKGLFGISNAKVNVILMFICAILMFYSLIRYLIMFLKEIDIKIDK